MIAPIHPPIYVTIRGTERKISIPHCRETRKRIALPSVASLQARLANVPDFDAVVAELRARLKSGAKAGTRFTAIKADGTVGEFHMNSEGWVKSLCIYSRLDHFPAKR
jgi:hypothetical protein